MIGIKVICRGASVAAAFFAALAFLAPARADAPICDWHTTQTRLSVVGGAVSKMLPSANEGMIVDLLRRISTRTPFTFDLEVHSDKRAQRHFLDRHYDAYLLWSNFDPPLSPLKVRLGDRPLFAFVRKGDRVPTNITDLEGLRVGLPFVYSFPEELLANERIATMRLAESAESNLEALARGRVDATIVAGDAARDLIAARGIENVTYDPTHPIFSKEIYMVLQPVPGLECTATLMQHEIELMRADGSLRAILGPLGD